MLLKYMIPISRLRATYHTVPRDYHQILGVSHNESVKNTKEAYYDKAKTYHPDTKKDSSGALKFQENSEPYEIYRGIDLIRQGEEGEKCLFPTINQLGVSTDSKLHRFEVSCDKLIKFIKLGAINKNIALQYCHYLAHLTRTCDGSETDYYAKRCLDLLIYLMRNNKDLTIRSQFELFCDVSDTTTTNCTAVCNLAIKEDELGAQLAPKSFTKLLASCYKFNLWEVANSIVSKYYTANIVTPWLFDFLIAALPNSIEAYKNLSESPEEQKKFKASLTEHLLTICEHAHRDRIQFITKQTAEFDKFLENFGAKVVKNPIIKQSGRCTNCNSFLPIYNDKTTTIINKSIKNLLHQRLVDKYYLHSSPRDLERFEEYLEQLYKVDRKPVDLIVDGLNIAYKNTIGIYYIKKAVSEDVEISQKRHNPKGQAQVLINTMIRGNMLQNFRKILVIGREHMRNWPGLLEFFEAQKVHYYFSLNHSKDDLFQLYAATLSPKTLLVTGDFLRDHLAMLDQNSRIAFERWIDTHQVWIQKKTLKPIWPTPFEKVPSAQRDTGHIHIPVIDFHKLATLADHEAPPHLNNKMLTWACCKFESE